MSVKRSLQLEDKENTPLKVPASERTFSPHTGTCVMSPGPGTEGRCQTTSAHKTQTAQQKKLEKLRDNLKKTVESILKDRQDLESQLPLEGSSELNRLFPRGTGDMLTELEKHRKLVDKVGSGFVMGTVDGKSLFTGFPPAGNSSEFLRSLLK